MTTVREEVFAETKQQGDREQSLVSSSPSASASAGRSTAISHALGSGSL